MSPSTVSTSASRVSSAATNAGTIHDTDGPSDLPTPSVSLPQSSKPQPEAREPSPSSSISQPPPTPPMPQKPAEQDTPSADRSQAPLRKPSFGDPEADPWGSPDLHRGHNHSFDPVLPQTNGANIPPHVRTTSQFTTQSHTNSSSAQGAAAPPSSLPSDGGWGGYNGSSNQTYTAPDVGAGGFGTPAAGNAAADVSRLSGSIGRLPPTGSGAEEVITITAIAEKEGLFMFQHRNYEVGSNRRANKVVRRYSDFVWLLDCLHKRFPFRQLPLLPPKRVACE
jgi:sorting nexin-8